MSMAMEGRVRQLHRRDWPGFLTHMVPAGVWQALARTVAGQDDPRVRWFLKYILLVYIGIGWSPQRCLVDRFGEARDWPHKKNDSPPGPPNLRRLNRHERTSVYAALCAKKAADS